MAIHQEQKTQGVLVVGGGVAGLQAAVDLAESGYQVHLVDRAPLIGGLMPQLDKTFPTNDCAMCFIAPKSEDRSGCLRAGVAVWRHPRIEVLPNTELKALAGEAGNFQAVLETAPRFIDPDTCTACGQCVEVCPERAVNVFNAGLDRRAAAYLPFPQAVPRIYQIDEPACTKCGACVDACPVEAVNLAEAPRERSIQVGAVVLAVGNQVFDPSGMPQYLHGQHPNVVTSLEYERLYSGTGPTLGRLVRPSDGTPPQKIAWLQCIGSRDVHTHSYCSGVCCMYAIKEAMIAQERLPGAVETTIFYMDMRVVGKEYEQYYTRARDRYGIRFICYRVPSIAPADNGDLKIEYFDAEGRKQTEVVNLVVLAVGFEVSPQARELAQRLGLDLDRHHYPVSDPFVPVASSRPGIYLCGTFPGPKDIPESVTEASAAAALCRPWLGQPAPVDIPPAAPARPERTAGSPRLGIFFCGFGPELAERLDLAALKAYAESLPGVVVTGEHPLDCSPAGLAELARQAAEAGVNRVILAACTPWPGEPALRQEFVQAGFNKYLMEVVNIRGEAAWVHPDRDQATAKARDLLRQAAARVRLLQPLAAERLPLNRQALVVGGGVAGLNAALGLARQGISVYLIEQTDGLGGLAGKLHRTIEGHDVGEYVTGLIDEVTAHPGIEVLLETRLVRQAGSKGNFLTTVAGGPAGRERVIRHGAVVLATGGREYRPTEHLYGQDPRVMTQLELGQRLKDEPSLAASWQKVVMIQCVGSRSAQNPNCSRICCQAAVKHVLELKKAAPELDIVILHRDMRMYGLLEDYYTAARDQKVLFERFAPAQPPEVELEGDKLQVRFWDAILGRRLTWPVDAVILSAGVVAADTADLADILKVARSDQGFWVESHPKLRPVDGATEGYYLCGLGHSPRLMKEAAAQGLAAAARAGAFLASATQVINPIVAQVDQGRCVGCLACARTCPYQVPRMDEQGRSVIDPALCLGCGVCTGVCPARAIGFAHYSDEQLRAEMSA